MDALSSKNRFRFEDAMIKKPVRACGNSVCPPIARALVAANVGELVAMERMERAA